VAVEVPAALPPVVLLAGVVPAPLPPVAPVAPVAPVEPVAPVAPTLEPPVVETAPPAAGGVGPVFAPPEVEVDVAVVDPAVVDVELDPVEVVTVGAVACPVVGTVKVGTAPVATVPDPPPPHAASISAAITAPIAARIRRVGKRRTSIPSNFDDAYGRTARTRRAR
jgi:hypothetical protein